MELNLQPEQCWGWLRWIFSHAQELWGDDIMQAGEDLLQTETWSSVSLEVLSAGTPLAMLTEADFYQ